MTAVSGAPGDSKFARALASSDYHVRSKGLAALHVWLQRKQSVPDMGLRKLWRGIMFCFWHSDKIHVQQQLADQLVKIMIDLSDEVALSYFQAFVQTMYREWGAIDKLRLDKFMMLVRKFVREVFSMLQSRSWNCDLVKRYATCIHNNAFSNGDGSEQIGFSLHLADVYIPELLAIETSALPSSLPHDQCVALLQPWIAVLARSKQPTLVHRIKTSVLEAFADELQSKPTAGTHKAFASVKSSLVSEIIFTAGAAAGVPTKNRAVLYSISESFKTSAKKRRREPAQPATLSGRDQSPVRSDLGVSPNVASDTANPAQCPDTDALQPAPKKKKLRAQAKKAGGASSSAFSRGGRDVHDRTKSSGARIEEDASNHGHRKSDKKGGSKGSAGGKRQNGASKPMDTQANGAMHHDAVMLTPKAEKALSGAVDKVQNAKSKKRISFDLTKNVIWKANQPLPPAAIRTPPSAKPNGSALKATSSVAKPKAKAARRISF